MTVIKAKVMDSMHLELEKEIGTSEKEVFVKILRRGIVESAKVHGALTWIARILLKI